MALLLLCTEIPGRAGNGRDGPVILNLGKNVQRGACSTAPHPGRECSPRHRRPPTRGHANPQFYTERRCRALFSDGGTEHDSRFSVGAARAGPGELRRPGDKRGSAPLGGKAGKRQIPRRADGPGPCGAFVCGLRARNGWTRRCRPFAEGFCVELQGRSHLSSGLVLRWFQGHLQRCLPAVRYRLQERCRVSLSACPGQPPTLHILPCSDYVCCHISMAVRLIPAVPLGDALYLTALPAQGPHGCPGPEALWGLNASRQEQRLLGWLKEQAPGASCHLKCLQILKGLRDLRGHGLEEPLCSQWRRVLSSYVLKTALFSLLLRGPLEAWDERFLVERLEELVLYLRDCLRKQLLMDFFLGNASIPEAVALPRFLKEAAPVNLLSAFDRPTLDLVAFQLVSTWIQAPHLIRMYSSPRYLRPGPGPCRHTAQEPCS
ncbi:PREDICTED: inositol 1,4,5-trisphosphate receptor-interacting protein-like 2 [Ficedula albicollis]|uniref:inositol 1,4,5-trisphosphate receptor-interacting protein-like 2 n=1 Tax=Ficedula albicollis TaxID=59894 RepID=UPI0007AD9088|nr:PREDICTED: inositol 1,4,5-trisphosphate receptor-interacting protein-like 2 [Ficedula albicollis]